MSGNHSTMFSFRLLVKCLVSLLYGLVKCVCRQLHPASIVWWLVLEVYYTCSICPVFIFFFFFFFIYYHYYFFAFSKYVNLGIPSSHYPPKTLGNQDGVLLKYVEGDVCQNDVRWQTNLLLVCNKNVPEVKCT